MATWMQKFLLYTSKSESSGDFAVEAFSCVENCALDLSSVAAAAENFEIADDFADAHLNALIVLGREVFQTELKEMMGVIFVPM